MGVCSREGEREEGRQCDEQSGTVPAKKGSAVVSCPPAGGRGGGMGKGRHGTASRQKSRREGNVPSSS